MLLCKQSLSLNKEGFRIIYMQPVIKEEEKKNNKTLKNIIMIVAFLILFIVGSIFFFYWLAKSQEKINPPSDDSTKVEEPDSELTINQYNRLLELLNMEAISNSVPLATELVTFHYDMTYRFYIVGRNDSRIYDYSIDMVSLSYPTIEESLEYLLENDPSSSMTEVFDNLTPVAIPDSFVTNYLTSEVKHKTSTVEMGSITFVSSTMYNTSSKKINVIYQQDVNNIVTNTEIDKTSDVYPLYRYIARRA